MERTGMSGFPPVLPIAPGLSPQERWSQLRHIFVEEILRSILALVVIALPVSLSRSLTTGWQPLYSLHIGIAVVYLGLYSLRNRMPLEVKASIPILIYWALAVGALVTWGLVGNGVFALTIINLMTALIYSSRVTIAMIVASLAVLAAIGVGVVSGFIIPHVNVSLYAVDFSSWATTWVLFCIVLMTIFRSLGVLQQSTQTLLQEIHQQQEEIVYLANHDQLTGLPLLRLARDRFEIASHRALRNGTKLAILFVDLDGFKEVNDGCGHGCGDLVLRTVAQRLRQAIRAEDTVARIGGDEFLVLLGDVAETESLQARGEALLLALAPPIATAGKAWCLGASIGIALFPDDGTDLDALRGLADAAMYEAKRSGNDRIKFVEPAHVS
jgi:diguanylate cyclase (GGDEF)-like protein